MRSLETQNIVVLGLALSNYIGHPWLDAPTHPDYEQRSPFDVYELGSLKDFPQDIKQSLAYRIAAHVARCIGRRRQDGTRAPTANLFDEMWEIKEEYPFIFRVLQHAGRKLPPSQTQWKPPTLLRRGQIFSWVVTALIDGKEIVSPSASTPEVKFAILLSNDLNQLNLLKKSNSHLALGVFYSRAGLVSEAEREFQKLIQLNPQSELPRKLLQSARNLRKAN